MLPATPRRPCLVNHHLSCLQMQGLLQRLTVRSTWRCRVFRSERARSQQQVVIAQLEKQLAAEQHAAAQARSQLQTWQVRAYDSREACCGAAGGAPGQHSEGPAGTWGCCRTCSQQMRRGWVEQRLVAGMSTAAVGRALGSLLLDV